MDFSANAKGNQTLSQRCHRAIHEYAFWASRIDAGTSCAVAIVVPYDYQRKNYVKPRVWSIWPHIFKPLSHPSFPA